MTQIITVELVLEAIDSATPTVLKILAKEGTTWGPKYVDGYVIAPGIEDMIQFTIGNPRPGEERFLAIAEKKAFVSDRTGMSTRDVITRSPWQLEEHEYLYPGGVHCDGITVATSGATGSTDEGIANIILSCIMMFAYLETDRRIDLDEMQI